MKKALFIAYRFPPQGGGGIQRTLKFIKYLPLFDWLPVIHTVKNPYQKIEDESLLREIPEKAKVYRSPAVEFAGLERKLASLLKKGKTANKGLVIQGSQSQPNNQNKMKMVSPPVTRPPSRGRVRMGGDLQDKGLLNRIPHYLKNLIYQWLFIPDPQIGWLPLGVIKSIYILKKEKINLIYSTSPPHSSQLIGLILKYISKKAWVVDFRDLWIQSIHRRELYEKNSTRKKLEEFMEKAVIKKADFVIANTEKNREHLLGKYPSIDPKKIVVITNGFDPQDFEDINAENKKLEKTDFNITLTGEIESLFDAAPFLEAVKELIEEESAIRSCLKINFVGTTRDKYQGYLTQNGLNKHIRYLDYAPHQECIGYLYQSDLLLVVQIPEEISAGVKIPGKLYEYFCVNKPILALTLKHGLTAQYLQKSGLGFVVEPHDQQEIKRVIKDIFIKSREGTLSIIPNQEFIQQFDRRRLTEQLAQVFDETVNG